MIRGGPHPALRATFSRGEKGNSGQQLRLRWLEELLFDDLEDGLDVVHHITVLKTQRANTLRLEPLSALKIVRLSVRAVVRSAVEFDYQALLMAVKVSAIPPNDLLTHELVKMKAAISKEKPRPRLGNRQLLAAFPRQHHAVIAHRKILRRPTPQRAVFPPFPFSLREKVALQRRMRARPLETERYTYG